MNTSVYLVSYNGLLVKTTTQNCLFVFLFVLLCPKKKKKNLADPIPAGCFHSCPW